MSAVQALCFKTKNDCGIGYCCPCALVSAQWRIIHKLGRQQPFQTQARFRANNLPTGFKMLSFYLLNTLGGFWQKALKDSSQTSGSFNWNKYFERYLCKVLGTVMHNCCNKLTEKNQSQFLNLEWHCTFWILPWGCIILWPAKTIWINYFEN